jgi:tetratricopeptide (TPR) repeat protein
LVCAVLCLSGCGRPATDPPVITSGAQFSDVLEEARALSEGPLTRFDAGQEPSESDRAGLREAARLLEGLSAFKPENFGVLFLTGKTYQALGEHVTASERFRDCANAISPETKVEEVRSMLAEAYALRAVSLERVGAFEEAEQSATNALALYSNNPNYLAALASAEIQLGKRSEAQFHLKKALLVDPEHRRSLQLVKLLAQGG